MAWLLSSHRLGCLPGRVGKEGEGKGSKGLLHVSIMPCRHAADVAAMSRGLAGAREPAGSHFASMESRVTVTEWKSEQAATAAISPLFVVGAIRSGTSLLHSLINQHPKVALVGVLGVDPAPVQDGHYRASAESLPEGEHHDQVRSGRAQAVQHGDQPLTPGTRRRVRAMTARLAEDFPNSPFRRCEWAKGARPQRKIRFWLTMAFADLALNLDRCKRILFSLLPLDSPETIADRVRKAASMVDPRRLTLNSDCGFSPESGARVPVDEAYQKLRHQVSAAERLGDEFGG